MIEPRFLQQDALDSTRLAAEAAAGLLAQPARVPPKFFYDELGSRLFDAITALDEYYPTRTEAAIFGAHEGAIADAVLAVTGPRPAMVEPGAGNCAKAARWFRALAPQRYVAVDISAEYLREHLLRLQPEHPDIEMVGLGSDFGARLDLPPDLVRGPAVLFYPGSSIGNFAPPQALQFLRALRASSRGGALLIGADLVKSRELLDAAYDDALGVTAAFNLNLLRHLNRRLGTDFAVQGWRHVAFFDEAASRVEMHLEARAAVTVRWPGGERRFAAGERIHTEDSYKWRPEGFESLLRESGFARVRRWTDAQGWFGVFVAAG